jgi:succinoglycan biosynthesis transport protein ExoP
LLVTDLSLVPRENPVTLITTPVIPLNFVYPGLSLAQMLSIALAHWKSIFLIGFTVLAVTGLVMKMWPRTYTAVVTLMVNYEVNDPLNGKELPVGQLNSYIATQVELMQTPEVLLAVIDRLGLTQNDEYSRGYRPETGTLREWVATKLRKDLVIYRGQGGSQLINVAYTAHNPAEAARIANSVADIYKEQDYQRSTGPPSERANRYAEELTGLKGKVDQAQRGLTAFRQQNGLIDAGDTNVGVILLATLEGRLLEAQNARRVAASRASQDASVSDQVLSSDLVQNLKNQLAGQELVLAQREALYTKAYPGLLDLQTQAAATRRALASITSSYSSNASAALSAAQRLEGDLEQALAVQRKKVLSEGQSHDEAAKYLLELQSSQTVYKRALEGYDQIIFAAAGNYSNVSVVSRATPPVIASKPKLLTGLMLGLAAAAVLGFGIPLSFELFNRRVRCRDDVEREYGIPVLAEFQKFPVRRRA